MNFARRLVVAAVLTVLIGLWYQDTHKAPASTKTPPGVVAETAPPIATPRPPAEPPIALVTPPVSPPDSTTGRSRRTVSERGVGPIEFGMTSAQAAKALGGPFNVIVDDRGCGTVVWPSAPDGVSLIVDGNRILGAMVSTGDAETPTHVKIGSSEESMLQAYTHRTRAYTDTATKNPLPHETTISPGVDARFQIAFVIVNFQVASYTAGDLNAIHHRRLC